MNTQAFEIITEPQAAEILRISAKTLSRMRKAGEVPYLPGKPVRYVKQSLVDHIISRQIQPAQPAPRPIIRKSVSRSISDKRAMKLLLLP